MKKISPVFLFFLVLFFPNCSNTPDLVIMSVNGPVPADKAGIALTHEHILVDFIGADSVNSNRWNRNEVRQTALPYLLKVKELGCTTFFECTPAFLGRDPLLMKEIADESGLNIVISTGYYGAGNDKYIPRYIQEESAGQIARRWIEEWQKGIDGTPVRPGFIKIGVAAGPLSDLHRKLITAAAIAHLQTGLTIVSHTGQSIPAFEQLAVLKEEGVSPEAFIWVHAQSEKDLTKHTEAAKMGAWISLDGLNEKNAGEYLVMIQNMKQNKLLDRVLLSHDAGWYHPGEKNGGDYRGYTPLLEKLVPLLQTNGFTEEDIHMLLVSNPARAFAIRVRKAQRVGK